ncbi:MAG: N-acetylmuramoyl-L-alanine amidase [Candidatus Pacebacteria bacterium]|nr:N-acetylmuramoyl-L-alanine amidase [Candidatus Paceibacterota bacterium]
MKDELLRLAAYAGCVASAFVLFIAGGATPVFDAVVRTQAAAVFFVTSITSAQIQETYRASGSQTSASEALPAKKVKILIVPGHEPDTGGTEYQGVVERDVVVDIADALATLLAQNPHYEVMVARTKIAWNPLLQNYFDTHMLEIETFEQSQKAQMTGYLADGSILSDSDQVYHNAISTPGALKLYGINKWASDAAYDITLHLHINDYAGRRLSVLKAYNGFAMYVPDHQYSNAEASRTIGEALAGRLSAYHATSTLPKEDAGIVEDQQLIAIGSNNSANDASLLIEYGYIQEPQFQIASVRPLAIADYAYQTYLGLQDFFKDPIKGTRGSVSFPYDWTKLTGAQNEKGPGIYALQAALHHLGFYPPREKNFNDCPISGRAGSCTRSAIMQYQRSQSLEATGQLGPQTRSALTRDLEELSTESVRLK